MKLKMFLFPSLIVLFLLFSFLGIKYLNFHKQAKVAGVQTQDQSIHLIKGLVLPHHELAFDLVDETLLKVSQQQQPEYVVLIGPNHWQPDKYHVITATDLTDYPMAEEEIMKMKDKLPWLAIDNQLVSGEHSIMLLLPKVVNYFPQAKVIPLVFSPNYDPEEIKHATTVWAGMLPANTLYVISVDFAHNQMLTEALEHNQETIQAITNFEYQRVLDFDDQHLDASVAMVYLMTMMERLEATNWQTWHSTHGAELTGDPTLQGTSYVIGVFY